MKVGGTFKLDDIMEQATCDLIVESGMTAIQIVAPELPLKFDLSWFVNASVVLAWRGMDVDIYVHAPFNINPCDPAKAGWNRMRYMQCIRLAEALGAKGVVLHTGSRKELSEAEAAGHLLLWLEKVCSRTEIATLLEVDAGSKAGTRVGSPEFVKHIVTKMNTTKVRICVDTAHLYGRGIDMWDTLTRCLLLEQLEGLIGLVHLNSPDPEVKLGGFLDRHSTSFFGNDRPNRPMINAFVHRFPCILERGKGGPVVMAQDMVFIKLAIGPETGII